MKSRNVILAAAFSMFFILAGCSSDKHSITIPSDEDVSLESSSSFTLDDLDDILNEASSSSKKAISSSSTKEKVSSSSTKRTGSSSSKKSSRSSSSKKTEPKSSSSQKVTLPERKHCIDDTSSTIVKALAKVKDNSVDMFKAFGKRDIDQIRTDSKSALEMYRKILKKSPNSCEAQIGYAITSVINLSNDTLLDAIIDTYRSGENSSSLNEDNVINNIINTANEISTGKKTITQKVQEEIINYELPTIDSAIVYLQNILDEDDYTLNIAIDGQQKELDKSEFAPALGLLFAVKAFFTMASSINLEFSNKNTYDWINDFRTIKDYNLNKKQTQAVRMVVSLIGFDKMFTTVYNDRIKDWNSIPDLLDSAFTEARSGFKYSIKESSKPGKQDNDIYVVGDGADADVSIDDIQDIITALDIALDAIESPYKVNTDGINVTIDVRKFFESNKSIFNYAPYYAYSDESNLCSYYFTNAEGDSTLDFCTFIERDYESTEEMKKSIVFPDPSFGGIFPYIKTQEDLWDLLEDIKDNL